LDWLKKLGPTQNILGPVKGQGIRSLIGLSKRISKRGSMLKVRVVCYNYRFKLCK